MVTTTATATAMMTNVIEAMIGQVANRPARYQHMHDEELSCMACLRHANEAKGRRPCLQLPVKCSVAGVPVVSICLKPSCMLLIPLGEPRRVRYCRSSVSLSTGFH